MERLALFLAVVAARFFIGGFVVMLIAGMIHSEVASLADVIPAWSFRESVFVSIGLTLVGSYFQNPTSSD